MRRGSTVKKFCYLLFIVYISISAFIIYTMYIQHYEHETVTLSLSNKSKTQSNQRQWSTTEQFVGTLHIWGKAAIAEYIWSHILDGSLQQTRGLLLFEGSVNIEKLKIVYWTGPSLMVDSADTSVSDLVVILNGREESKVNDAKVWLDALFDKRRFRKLRNLGIFLHGNEFCDNSWLWRYLDSSTDLLKFIFIVYDVNEPLRSLVYQWPLGVATYRGFPLITKNDVDVHSVRKHRCNFLGTIYPNSSREVLYQVLKDLHGVCYVKVRHQWWDKETEDSMATYHNILKNSDLTLCPVGINSESYRIYEAMSYGSVPVLEDVVTPGRCGKSINGVKIPFYLLKKYKAPVIYIKQWEELPRLLQHEKSLSQRDLIARRRRLLDWYEMFRYKMREEFLSVTKVTFQ